MTTATLEKTCATAAPVRPERRTVIPEHRITQKEEHYEIQAHLPGVSQENLKIQLEDQWLKVSGEPTSLDTSLKPLHVEFTDRNYECRFKIPHQIDRDQISARLKNGVLTVTLPRAKEHQRRNISVTAS